MPNGSLSITTRNNMIEPGDAFHVAVQVDGHDLASKHVGEPQAPLVPSGTFSEDEPLEEKGGF